MKQKTVLLLSVLIGLFVMTWTSNVLASGIGPYLEFGAGSGSFDHRGVRTVGGEEQDVDVTGFGFMIDSNLSQPEIFNYRLAFGYNTLDYPGEYDGWRISMDNTFGFEVMTGQKYRIWLGPQLHLSYGKVEVPYFNWGEYFGFSDDGYVLDTSDYTDNHYDDRYDDLWGMGEVDAYGVGFGMVTGANFNFFEGKALCAELGMRFQRNYLKDGGKEYSFTNGNLVGVYVDDTNYSYHETVVTFKVSFMFGD